MKGLNLGNEFELDPHGLEAEDKDINAEEEAHWTN